MIDMSKANGPTSWDNPGGLLGKPVDRLDGPLKVTGRATYASEHKLPVQPVHGYLVTAGIGAGLLSGIGTDAAERAPGVLLVLTHENMPPQGTAGEGGNPQLTGPQVVHYGQPIAFVVADTFENARAAASLVQPTYARAAGRYDLAARLAQGVEPPSAGSVPPDSDKGDVDAAFRAAAVTVDATYATPPQTHAMMEPHATIASWDGDELILRTSNRMLPHSREIAAKTLQLPQEKVRLVSPYIGGSFGAKQQVEADAILAGVAARILGRPVKVVLTRQQVFHVVSHRTDTVQRIRLAADEHGALTAVAHESWSDNAPDQSFFESAAGATRSLYATPNLMTSHRLVTLNLPVSAPMRAPGEGVGLLALEAAMDELAVALAMDPVELRKRNEPAVEPATGRQFSSRMLVPCLERGAELFGWGKRNPRPAQVRDGSWLVGMGMASAIRGNPMQPAKASAGLDADGILTIRTSMTDVGTGSYTILGQIAADLLGFPIDRVRVELGDTDLPPAPGSGGSSGANSAGSAVYDACMTLREELLDKGGLPADATFEHGAVTAGGTTLALESLVGPDGLTANGAADPGDSRRAFSQQSYGAHFAEVGVDEDTGEIRVRRMLGVFAAGRILNAKAARSQAIGGMTFGIGAALTEALVIDKNCGSFVNHDLAEYHVPTQADVPAIEVVFLGEADAHSNPMGSKGLGELGICGAGAAVANAVYNATGLRIRDYPLTLDKMLRGWAAADRTQTRGGKDRLGDAG